MLGEQSAKQLRGARMDEVIFDGNAHRRPLGLAEVTLTFENADGVLATPFAEIAVTRRVYRTGESEYFLNRSQVRLRDIMDLLLGTGLGPDASAIVSQGQIDAILSAKPADRRELFEEAAGTSKYQARKREAQRRLEQTESNALRVNDVLAEIESQIPAMETQVRRAKRYRKATQMLRDLEILSYLRKSEARRAERESLAPALQTEEAGAGGAGVERERLTAQAHQVRYDEYQATLALDEATASSARAAERARDAATAHAAAEARSEDADRRCLDAVRDLQRAALAVEESKTKIDVQARELAASRERRDAALAAAQTAAAEERQSSLLWEKAYGELRALEDRRATSAADAAECESAAQAAAAEHERLSAHERVLLERLEDAAAQLRSARAAESELLAQIGGLDAAVASAGADHGRETAARDTTAAEADRLQTELFNARDRTVEAKARLQALQDVDAMGAGVPSGVKAIVAQGDAAARSGILGVLSDLIEVDAAHAVAIDVALGAKAHDLIAGDARAARWVIDLLKRTKAGRATVLTLDLTRQMQLPLAPKAADARGVVGRAADLVRCSAEVRPAVEHLLGGALVVESLDDAQRLMPLGPGLAVVTLDGDLVSGASITGGSGDGDTGPLARRATIAQLVAVAAAASSSCEDAERRCESARAAHARAVGAVAAAAEALSSAHLRRRDLDGALDRARADIDARDKNHDTLADDALQARRDCERATADAARYAEASARAREAAAGLEEQRIASAQRADALNATLGELRDRHRIAAAEAAALVERVAQAGDDIDAARSAHADCVRAHEMRAAGLEESRLERETVRGHAAELSGRKSEEEAAVAAALTGVDEMRAKRDAFAASARELEERLEAAQAHEREQSMELERTRIRVAEIDAELALLQETFSQNPATDEERASVAGRYASFEGEADAEIRRLRDECARLGNVNLNALEDQIALEERREFLRRQLADLESARASILSAIADIDEESLRKFNATFEQIAKAFAETFARLFSGGVGKIWLGESDDPTQAGIEIAAQPPGKKMQSLSLLSGGERAMTAVALIFAILQVRPCPFYIFDEIDAALDEANIGRFGAMLREIAGRAQTIIITHNKATMTLADRIYGVTMGEPGVSNILSLALEQASA